MDECKPLMRGFDAPLTKLPCFRRLGAATGGMTGDGPRQAYPGRPCGEEPKAATI